MPQHPPDDALAGRVVKPTTSVNVAMMVAKAVVNRLTRLRVSSAI